MRWEHPSKFPPDLTDSNQIEFWGHLRHHPPITPLKVDQSSNLSIGKGLAQDNDGDDFFKG
jgi:hypothetical protein